MNTSLAIKSILDVVNKSYENGELQIDKSVNELGHSRGDSLAEFLHLEITEVCQGNEANQVQQLAINSIDTAIAQLVSVRESLAAATIYLNPTKSITTSVLVSVEAVEGKVLDEDDKDWIGAHKVFIEDGTPDKFIADIALDVFSGHVPISNPEHFVISVFKDGEQYQPNPNHEPYTFHKLGRM